LGDWIYTRLPSTTKQGSLVDHQYEKNGIKITFLYDNGQDEYLYILAGGLPWGRLELDHPLLKHANFDASRGSPTGMEKILQYIYESEGGLFWTSWLRPLIKTWQRSVTYISGCQLMPPIIPGLTIIGCATHVMMSASVEEKLKFMTSHGRGSLKEIEIYGGST
jgi:hypothetical protein